MPTITFALPEDNAVYARCSGHLVPKDIIDWNVDNRVASDNSDRFLVIVDLSDVTGTDMTFRDINAIHGKLNRHYSANGNRLHLVFFAPDDLAFGMTRILESLSAMSDFIKVEIYRTLDAMNDSLEGLSKSFSALKQNFQSFNSDMSL